MNEERKDEIETYERKKDDEEKYESGSDGYDSEVKGKGIRARKDGE